VDEGVRVFDALIEALRANPTERLVVEPHPHDSVSLLEERLQACRVADRVSISAVPALELTAKAKLVVSEDSTCGLEAMLLGKPLVHAHFAASAPVMPFVSYGAALPGFRAGELASAVDTLVRGDYDQEALQAGQRRFIGDFAGPMDGMGTERVCRQVLG
jgi:UDP-N-acetylglucosamine 2-epimerase